MPDVIQVGDLEEELVEALTHPSATPRSAARTRRCDAVLDDLLELRQAPTPSVTAAPTPAPLD